VWIAKTAENHEFPLGVSDEYNTPAKHQYLGQFLLKNLRVSVGISLILTTHPPISIYSLVKCPLIDIPNQPGGLSSRI
jgi:hypothetical protein